MAKPTSSSTRSRRSASKRPTSSKTRATRSNASNARVTRSGQGSSRGSSTRVTRGSSPARAGTGSARVTGGSRPALPPGKTGGQLAIRRGARRTNTNRATSSGRTQMGTRGSAKPQLRLPAAKPGAAANFATGLSKVAGTISLLLSAGVISSELAASLRRGEGLARIPGLLRRMAKDRSGGRRKGGQGSRGGRERVESSSKPKPKPKPAASKPNPTPKTDRLDRDERRARERSRETPPPAPRLPPPPAARSTARPKPQAKPKSKVSKTHTYKEHGSALHIGRHKTLAEHRAAVAKNKKKKNNNNQRLSGRPLSNRNTG